MINNNYSYTKVNVVMIDGITYSDSFRKLADFIEERKNEIMLYHVTLEEDYHTVLLYYSLGSDNNG